MLNPLVKGRGNRAIRMMHRVEYIRVRVAETREGGTDRETRTRARFGAVADGDFARTDAGGRAALERMSETQIDKEELPRFLSLAEIVAHVEMAELIALPIDGFPAPTVEPCCVSHRSVYAAQ